MSIDEIVAAISRLETDAIAVATALQEHATKLPISSPEYARLHKLHRAICDFYNALNLAQKPKRDE